jgi:hypothetical protein
MNNAAPVHPAPAIPSRVPPRAHRSPPRRRMTNPSFRGCGPRITIPRDRDSGTRGASRAVSAPLGKTRMRRVERIRADQDNQTRRIGGRGDGRMIGRQNDVLYCEWARGATGSSSATRPSKPPPARRMSARGPRDAEGRRRQPLRSALADQPHSGTPLWSAGPSVGCRTPLACQCTNAPEWAIDAAGPSVQTVTISHRP